VRFTKGHGTGNDFVLLPDPEDELRLDDAAVQRICDRRTGIGADGILRVVRTRQVPEYAELAGDAPWFMDYRNSDGGAVEMCGNGVRVFARYLREHGHVDRDDLRIATRDGTKSVTLHADGSSTVDMGAPRDVELLPDDGVFVSMGNPHIVLFEEAVATAPVASVGATLDREWEGGANVEFTVVEARDRLRLRVWERGVGETLSCGTGACAALVAAAIRERADRRAVVHLPGGSLDVEWREDTVLMTGPAELVADGELNPEWLARAR
jgi:diaminopimelate epimerase